MLDQFSKRRTDLQEKASGSSNMDLEKSNTFSERNEETVLLTTDTANSSYDAFAHENQNHFPDGGFEAWSVAVGCCFGLMSVIGIMDCLGSIQLYIVSYQLQHVKLSSVSWIFSLYMFTNLSLGTIAGPIFDIYGVKKVLLVGIILNCGGLYATAFAKELWHFILSFGICAGVGGGLMLTPLFGVVNHWFLRNRGKANGVAGFGSVSGVFFPIMLRALFPKIGYMKTMVTLASLCVIFSAIAWITVKDRCEILNAEQLHIPKSQRLLETYKHMLNFNNFKEKAYTFLVTGMFFNEFSIMIVSNYITTYTAIRGFSDSTAYTLVIIMNAAGIFGKLTPTLSDWIGRFNVMVMVCVIMIISLFAVWLPFYNLTGLIMFAIMYGFCFGSVFALTPVLIAQISHTKQFGSRFATAYFVVSFGNLVAMPIGSQFINDQTVHNYNHMIIFTACTCVVALCLIILSRISIAGMKIRCYV